MTKNNDTALDQEIKKEELADARGWENTALPETPAQTRARLFISYKMAQAELGRALDILLSMNPLSTHDEKVESARRYAKSASNVILGEYFDLENTVRDKDNV